MPGSEPVKVTAAYSEGSALPVTGHRLRPPHTSWRNIDWRCPI